MRKPNIYRTMVVYMDMTYKDLSVLIQRRYGEKVSDRAITDAVRRLAHGEGDRIRTYIVDIYADFLAGNI